jgi:hypothetical protein
MSNRDWHELDQRLDRAIDALNAEHAPESAGDDASLEDLIETARVLRRLREPAEPDEAFADRLVEAVAATRRAAANGVVEPGSDIHRVTRIPQRRTRWLLAQIAAVVRVVGVCVLAGVIAGAVVGGLGGRAAMRVSGYMYEREHPGQVAVTRSSGEPVGQISLDGTLNLIFETALFNGIPGGLLYLLVGPWLPKRRFVQGLVFSGLLLLVAGSVVIDSSNDDFRQLGSPVLNVAMFAALIVGYGLALVWLAGKIDRLSRVGTLLNPRRAGVGAVGVWIMTIGLGIIGLLVAAVMVSGMVFASLSGLLGGVSTSRVSFLALLIIALLLPAARILVALPTSNRPASRLRSSRLASVAIAAVIAALAVAAMLTVWSILQIVMA